jgi:hypothetical protein
MLHGRKDLFAGTRPATIGSDGETELPILYYKDEAAYFYFTADAGEVQKRLPSDKLRVVKVSPTRCMVALATYNYIHASVGSYGETVMAAIVMHDKEPKGSAAAYQAGRRPPFRDLCVPLPRNDILGAERRAHHVELPEIHLRHDL